MAWVQMLVKVSGGRADGSMWPDPWNSDGLLECGDAEAQDLVRAQIAVPAKAPARDPDVPVKSVTAAAPAAPEPEPEPAPPAADGPPLPSAPKQDWVDYAVAHGEVAATAGAMTKNDLISKYGGRL